MKALITLRGSRPALAIGGAAAVLGATVAIVLIGGDDEPVRAADVDRPAATETRARESDAAALVPVPPAEAPVPTPEEVAAQQAAEQAASSAPAPRPAPRPAPAASPTAPTPVPDVAPRPEPGVPVLQPDGSTYTPGDGTVLYNPTPEQIEAERNKYRADSQTPFHTP